MAIYMQTDLLNKLAKPIPGCIRGYGSWPEDVNEGRIKAVWSESNLGIPSIWFLIEGENHQGGPGQKPMFPVPCHATLLEHHYGNLVAYPF